jgi:hypothetical protein
MKTEEEFWACSVCRSMNPRRSDRCYSCHTPREFAGASPAEVAMSPSGPAPMPVPIAAIYQSSESRAVIVTVATDLFLLGSAVALWAFWSIGDLRAAGRAADADRLLAQRLPVLAAAPALGVVALLAYAAWISRVVANLPALGLGFSRVSPTMAFIEPLIPGMNLYSLPARAGEVLSKLEGVGRGHVLIGLAWLIGVTPAFAAVWILRIGRFTESGADWLRTTGVTFLVTAALSGVGILIGLVVIWHIEALCRDRAAPKT